MNPILAQTVASAASAVLSGAIWLLFARRKNDGKDFWWFLLVAFVAAWAGGLWLPPFGPILWDTRPAPYFVAGALFCIIPIVIASLRAPRGRRETLEKLEQMERHRERQKATFEIFKIMLPALILLVLAAIVAGRLIGV